MNYLTPIYILDDTNYAFHSYPEGFDLNRRIKSLYDVLLTSYHHWFYINGRVFTHFFVALFAGLLGKQVFNFFNALFFCLMLYFALRLIRPKHKLLIALFWVLAYLLFVPAFGQTTLWMAGSINYLWSAVFALIFFLLCQYIHNGELSLWRIIACTPLAFLLGWTHECFSLPITMALAIYVLVNKNVLYKRPCIILYFAYMLGTVLTCFSVASLTRLSSSGGGDFRTFFFFLSNLRLFWLFILVSFVVFYWRRTIFVSFIRKFGWLCLVNLFSLFVFAIIGGFSSRIMFSTEFFSLLLLSCWISYVSFPIKILRGITFFVLLLIAAMLYPILSSQKVCFDNYKRYEPDLRNPACQVVLTPQTPSLGKWGKYVVQHVEYGDYLSYMATDSENIDVKRASAFFNKSGMSYFPKDLYSDILSHPERYRRSSTIGNCGLYVKELRPHEVIKGVRLRLRPVSTGDIPFYERPFAKVLTKYNLNEIEVYHYNTMSIGSRRYFIFAIPDYFFASRIRQIVYF